VNEERALTYVRRLVASYPTQHIGEDTVREMVHEFTVIDESIADRVVDALKNSSAWFPTPFEVRKVFAGFREGADMARIRDFEDGVIRNVASIRNITYAEALEARRGAMEDMMNEAIEYNLDSAGYYALRLRVLSEMKAVVR
jgi:hypothetical protein